MGEQTCACLNTGETASRPWFENRSERRATLACSREPVSILVQQEDVSCSRVSQTHIRCGMESKASTDLARDPLWQSSRPLLHNVTLSMTSYSVHQQGTHCPIPYRQQHQPRCDIIIIKDITVFPVPIPRVHWRCFMKGRWTNLGLSQSELALLGPAVSSRWLLVTYIRRSVYIANCHNTVQQRLNFN